MFKEIDFRKTELKPAEMFGDDWCALSAGTKETGYNAMCIAWGEMGALWERGTHARRLSVATVYVRPSRYTKSVMDREPYFALNFLDDKKKLGYLGSHHGNEEDKFAGAGLTPVFLDGTTLIDEAKFIVVCKKLYQAPLSEDGFTDRELMDFNYPKRDFHTMYIGEIVKAYQKTED